MKLNIKYFLLLLVLSSCNDSPFSSCNVRPKKIIDGHTHLQVNIVNELIVGETFIVNTERSSSFSNKLASNPKYYWETDTAFIKHVKSEISIDKTDTSIKEFNVIYQAIKKGKTTIFMHRLTTEQPFEDAVKKMPSKKADEIVGEYELKIN